MFENQVGNNSTIQLCKNQELKGVLKPKWKQMEKNAYR